MLVAKQDGDQSACNKTDPSKEAHVEKALKSLQRSIVQLEVEASCVDDTVGPQLVLLLGNEDTILSQTLTKEQRNIVVRNNPAAIVSACQIVAQKQRANREGSYEEAGCVLTWRPSFIPFHIEYTFMRQTEKCQHLASVKDPKTKNPVSKDIWIFLDNLIQSGSICQEPCSSCNIIPNETFRKPC